MIYANNSCEALTALECQRTQDYGEIPKALVYTCSNCGGEIYDGDDCLVCDEGAFCRRCIMTMTSDDVVELLGYSFTVASEFDM